MTPQKEVSYAEHPAALGSFRSWLRVVRRGGGVDRAYLPRLLAVSLTTFLTSPLRFYEKLRYGRVVRRTAIHPSPVFILGHWRTGTTHLHNLLCKDPQFGYLTTFQAAAPGFCLMGERRIKPFLARKAERNHPTREIDNIPLSMDDPQEESVGIANLTPCASLHLYSSPRHAEKIFDNYALLKGITREERAEWTEAYLTLLRKVTLRSGGKRLVLKDPTNTGRIRNLLELFPEAKFVHIYRNPYRVLPSTVGTYRIVLPRSQLQDVSDERIEELVLSFYTRLMEKFLAEKSLIPAGNLVEVRYEDLDATPMEQLRKVYEGLALPGFAKAARAFRAYLDSVKGFRKNVYSVDDAVIEKVNRHWQFALEEWGYARLGPSATNQRHQG